MTTPSSHATSGQHAAANRRLGLILFGIFAVLTTLAALFIAMRPHG